MKVSHAKELADWVYLRERYGMKKEEMLRIAWVGSTV